MTSSAPHEEEPPIPAARGASRPDEPRPQPWPAPQGGFTTLLPLVDERIPDLLDYLDELGEATRVAGRRWEDKDHPFDGVHTLHFLRMFMVPDAGPCTARLCINLVHDGDLHEHLDALIAAGAASIFEPLLSCCAGYVKNGGDQAIKRHLLAHQQPVAFYFNCYPNVSAAIIRNDARLVDVAASFISDHRTDRDWPTTALGVRERIQAEVRDHHPGILTLGFDRAVPSKWRLAPLAVLGVLLSPLLVPLGVLWLLAIRANEKRTTADLALTSFPVSNLTKTEDYLLQNPLSHVVAIKSGRLRLYTLKVVLRVVGLLTKYIFNQGNTMGLNVIHFLCWHIIDEDRRLVMLSNFDGSFENYLGVFIDVAAVFINALWGNTLGFPSTRWFLLDGCKQARKFKQWARKQSLPTPVFYSAYPRIMVPQVIKNFAFRQEMEGAMTESQAAAWLKGLF